MQTTSILLVIAALGGCTPYDPALPAEPFYCGSTDPKCPDGFTCMDVAGGGSAVCTSGVSPGSGSGSCSMAHASGVLATWDLAGALGSQASTPSTSTPAGVMASPLLRATALMAASGTNSINSSNWATTAQQDTTKYYTLSITPPTGCTLSLSSLSIDVTSSSTGPASAAVATSADAFAQTASVSTTAPSTPTLSVSTASASIEIRVYGYNASAAAGTMRVQNMLTVTGTTQ